MWRSPARRHIPGKAEIVGKTATGAGKHRPSSNLWNQTRHRRRNGSMPCRRWERRRSRCPKRRTMRHLRSSLANQRRHRNRRRVADARRPRKKLPRPPSRPCTTLHRQHGCLPTTKPPMRRRHRRRTPRRPQSPGSRRAKRRASRRRVRVGRARRRLAVKSSPVPRGPCSLSRVLCADSKRSISRVERPPTPRSRSSGRAVLLAKQRAHTIPSDPRKPVVSTAASATHDGYHMQASSTRP